MALNRLKACGGLQPVPEESAANGTTAGAHPDAAAGAPPLPVNPLDQKRVKYGDGPNTNSASATADRRLRQWCSEDASAERPPPEDVSEKEYRIWFPRTEVSDEDSTNRASGDWRTFREYRYTECSRAGRLEKTLSVDEVYKGKDHSDTLAAAVPPPTMAFHCVPCSKGDEDNGDSLDASEEGRCKMLSSTKSELFREHRGRLLSRLIDDSPSPCEPSPLKTDMKPKLSEDPGTKDNGCWEKEARTSSVCQTSYKEVAFEDDEFAKKNSSSHTLSSSERGSSSAAPAQRSLSDKEGKSDVAMSAGVQDASLVSMDDDFDDLKCTYVKVDSVDSEVEDEVDEEGRETVIGASSPDELGYIAEEPEDEVDEASEVSGIQKQSSIVMHEATEAESSRTMSTVTESRQQELLPSNADVTKASEAGEKENSSKINGNTLETAARLVADVNELERQKSLTCHSQDSKESLLEEQNEGRVSYERKEQKDTAEALPRHDDFSDAETNESDTKSVESVISVKAEAIILPNTNDRSSHDVLEDTAAASANVKESSLDTGEMFGSSERLKKGLLSGETLAESASDEAAKSQEMREEDKEDILLRTDTKEVLQGASKVASLLNSEYTSSSYASHYESRGTESKSELLTHARHLKETEHSHKQLTESLDDAAHKIEHVIGEANLSRHKELRTLEDNQALAKDAAAHILDIAEHMEEIRDASSKYVVSSVTSEHTFNQEVEDNSEVCKQSARTVGECRRNDPEESLNERPKRLTDLSEPQEVEFSQLLKTGTLTEEACEFESVDRISNVNEFTEKTRQSVSFITDDSLLSKDASSDKNVEHEGQLKHPGVLQGLKESVESILQIEEGLKQDAYRSAEVRFLTNTEVTTRNILTSFAEDEGFMKSESQSASNILKGSSPRNNNFGDDVMHDTGDVKKRYEHLAETEVKELGEDVIEHFDDLALKNRCGFQAEDVFILDNSQMLNEAANKTEDCGVIVEKGTLTDNKENVPTILPDEHHLLKELEISSIVRQEGEGTGVMSTVVNILHEENSLSSSIKASMLKDVIALNRTDDATSVDDASLQDDNDQGFESLPCDQALDSEDSHDEQVGDESGDAGNVLPVDNGGNGSAVELSALLDELVGQDKDTSVSSQHETTTQTSSTEATDHKNETIAEPQVHSTTSNGVADEDGSTQKGVQEIELGENVHPMPAVSPDVQEHQEVRRQASETISGRSDSAVTDEGKITVIAARNREGEDVSGISIEESTSKTSDPRSTDALVFQQSAQEEEQAASRHNEKSEKLASEHSANQITRDEEVVKMNDVSVNESQDISGPTEFLKKGSGQFYMEKHANQSSSHEISEVKEETLREESRVVPVQSESTVRYEASEALLTKESANQSTSDSEIVKAEVDPSETKLRDVVMPEEANEQNDTTEHFEDGRTTYTSSNEMHVAEQEPAVDRISELISSGASVPNEASKESESEGPVGQNIKEEIVAVKAETPVDETLEIRVSCIAGTQSQTFENSPIEEPVCHSAENEGVTTASEEASVELVSSDLKTQGEHLDETANENTLTHIAAGQDVTNVKEAVSRNEFPEMDVSNELAALSKTSDVTAREEPGNHGNVDMSAAEVKAEISSGEVPGIVVSTEESRPNETSKVPVKEATGKDTECTNVDITKVEPHIGVCELTEMASSSELSGQSKTPDVVASEESLNHDNGITEATKVDAEVSVAEVLNTVASTEAIGRNIMPGQSASEMPLNENSDENTTSAELGTFVRELVCDGSSELSGQSKTCDEPASEGLVTGSIDNHDVSNVNTETPVNEPPEIVVSYETNVRSTSEEPASEEAPRSGTSHIEVIEETSFRAVPETVVSVELSKPSGTSEEPISEAPMNHNSTEGELHSIDSDESANELLKSAAFNESSPQSEASNRPVSEEARYQVEYDHLNTSLKNDTSVRKLPEIVTSNETTIRGESSGELVSEEAAQQAVTYDITEIKGDTRTSQFPDIAMPAETSLQNTPEKLEYEETTKKSTSVDASTEVRAETSNELRDVRVLSEAKVEDETTEDSASEEGVNRSTSIEQTAKVDAETPESESTDIVACNETIALSNAAENSSTEKTVLEGVSDGDNTAVDGQTSSNILPEIAAPDEANVQIKTSTKLEKDVVEDEDLTNIEMTEAKAGIITSELSGILPPKEDSVPVVTSQASTSRENPHETGGDVEIPKIMNDVPTSDVPEYPMYREPAVGSKSTQELKSDAAVNEGITDNDVADVKSDASIEEMSDVTALNEESVNEATEEATTSKGNAHQSSVDNGNAEMKTKISTSGLPEITESDNVNMQAAEELASQHPVTQNASDNYATDVTPGTSVNEPLEKSESIKCPECEEFGNTLSETSKVSLENVTKGGTSENVVMEVITEHGQPKAVCVERTGSPTKLAKRFANADSYDEFTEDTETGSTSADSGDGEQLGTTRPVKSGEGGKIEMVDKVPEGDVIRSSSEDITKGCIEIHASGDTHALNQERRRSQEESVRKSTEERFANQESVDDHAADAKTTTRGRSTSDGSTLEEVSAGFSEATEDDQTAVIEKGSEGVSNTAVEETAGGTSGTPSKEGDAHTSEPAKRSSEGTDGGDATWGRSSTEEIANVTDGREGRVELTDGPLESDKEEVFDTEISTCQDVVDATEPVTTEAYNVDALGTLVNSPLQQETKDDRSSLLEYAEEIVSTVLTRCVTYLEENNQEWRREKQAGRNPCELNVDTNSTDKEDAIKTTRDDDEKLRAPLPHLDSTNKDSYNGDSFEPIVPRPSALEEVASFSDHQNAVTSRDSTQAVVVGPASTEKEEDPNEVLSSPIPNEKQDEPINTGHVGEATANSETAENAETNAPFSNAEDVVISQITEEQRDGDAVDNTASISEVSTEDASSSKVDTNSSLSASKRDNEFPGQTVAQSDQSEDKRREEQSVVAPQLDAASRDNSEGVSEARQNFVVVENDRQRVESAHTVMAEEVIIGQEGQLHERLFTESSCSAGEGGFEHSAPEKDARRADDRENRDAENDTAVNSFSESSATTVSINTENSEESVSEHSTRVSKQESDVVQATEVTKDNPGESADEVHGNIPNSEYKETRSPNAQHTVVDSKDDAEWHEKSTFWPRTFRKSSGQSGIPHNALHGHKGWEISEGANTTVVPDIHDMSGQDIHPEAVVSVEENNQTNAFCTNVDYASQDKDISKPEGSAAVDNDMNSLGALSTVYESSLEYIRSYTDEHISASDVTATLIGDFSAVGKATSHQQQLPFRDSTAIGGVFQTDEHSDEEKAEEDSKESVETTSDIGAENESTQDVLKTKSDTEVTPGNVSDETSGAVSKPVDTNGSLAGLTDMHPQEERKTRVPQVLDDPTTIRETSEDNIAAMKDTGVVLQSQEKLEERQESPQMKSCQNITDDTSTGNKLCRLRAKSLDEEYRKRQGKERRGLQARSFDEENLKRHDTLSRGIATADEVPSGVFETKIRDTHAVLQEGEQPLEQDEVATMDFSDEEERSLEIEMGAREQIVSVDVHKVPNVRESGSIANGKTATDDAREEIVLEKANSAEATTNVNDMECTNRTEEANLTQLDEGIAVQKVKVGTEEHGANNSQDHNENADVEGPSDKLPQTIGALKTAVMVHDDTKLEAVECSEDLLQSVATEADFSSDIYEHVGDELSVDAGTDETSGERETGLPAASGVSSTHGDQRASSEECKGIEQVEASNEAKQRDQDGEPHKRSSSDALEDVIVPEHIQSPSNKSSTESESASEEQGVVANGDLKCAVEDFSRLISADGGDVQASKKSEEKRRTRPAAVIAESSNENAASEVTEGEDNDKNRLHNASDAKEDCKTDKDNQEDSLKTDSSESFDVSAAGEEDIDSGSRNVKENTTRKVTEAVEQSERTEGGIPGSGDPIKSTRIFQRTVKRTESTRTVRRTRSFLPYTKWIRGEKQQRARQETRDEDDVTEPVEGVLVAPQQAFPAMSIPRVGLCPMPDCSPGSVCSVAVQAFPSVVDEGVQVEFDEPDCITRLVELQIAMNEQEEVRRQDMKAACELVEKLEAMQLSESLMRTQLRAMDAERREQSAREARLRDELTAWQETVQQQQLLLQQLKEDLDDTEDTLAAQRQEANRLREQMLGEQERKGYDGFDERGDDDDDSLQESCDSGLLMVDVLGRADKEVQTPDGGQQSLSSSSPYKGIRLDNPSPVYLDQLSQHRRLSALVSSQLEATANRIAQLRREAAANRPRGSTIDEYVQELAEKEAIVHQLLLEQQQMDELLSEHDKILAHTRSESLKSKEGQMTPTLQTEEEKLCLVGARCLHENHPEVIARQARLLQRLQVDRIGVFRTPTPIDRSSAGSVPRRAEPTHRPYHALLTQYPVHRYGPRASVRATAGTPATGVSGSSAGGRSEASAGGVGSSTDPRRISFSSTSTTVNSRSHSVQRISHLRQLQSRQPHSTTAATAANRSHTRQPQSQSQSQSGTRQPTTGPARKTAETERVNRFVNPSRGGTTSKR